jgi:hypothetical protein
MSLEEYEALMLEKKKALNKQAETKNVDTTSELKGLKVFTKQTTEAQVGTAARPPLGRTGLGQDNEWRLSMLTRLQGRRTGVTVSVLQHMRVCP